MVPQGLGLTARERQRTAAGKLPEREGLLGARNDPSGPSDHLPFQERLLAPLQGGLSRRDWGVSGRQTYAVGFTENIGLTSPANAERRQ